MYKIYEVKVGDTVDSIANRFKTTKEDLKKIKGIGDQVAEEIINYRETHGGFSSKNELLNVSGIGERTFEKIKDQITL